MTIRYTLLRVLYDRPGLSAHELADALHLPIKVVSSNAAKLVTVGLATSERIDYPRTGVRSLYRMTLTQEGERRARGQVEAIKVEHETECLLAEIWR